VWMSIALSTGGSVTLVMGLMLTPGVTADSTGSYLFLRDCRMY
jgi:hypothetical protein